MKSIKLIFGLIILSNLLAYTQEQSVEPPWEVLFNGKNFQNWRILNDMKNAWVEDSSIVCHPIANTTVSNYICSEKKYDNFIFEVEAKIEGKLHTNFILRGDEVKVDSVNVHLTGYQIKIDPTDRRWTGGAFGYDNGKVVWYYPLTDREAAQSALNFGQWNKYRIEAIGDTIRVWVNDIPTCNLVHNKFSAGYISMKIHSIGNEPESEKVMMRFRNIRIITKNPEKYTKKMDYPEIKMNEQ